jgi:benzoyl-CoA reductase/2-hydroxyglutaryl-CoA dehydratase subunit BcrC/BadD/HgdB
MGAPISLSQSKSCLSGNISSHVQSMLECALRGDYRFLDGVIIGASSDATKRLYDAWIRYAGTSFNHLFDIPKIFGENALIHYKESINALIEDIESHFKVRINEQALKDAISICNKIRRLLIQLNNLRKENNPAISASQMLEICKLAMTTDKVPFNKELKTLLGKLGLSEEEKPRYRILLTGSFEDQDWLLNAVEEAGGSIVCEDTCTRLRYFYGLVDEDSEPIPAIAKRYMEYKIPSAGLVSFERRSNAILELVKEFKTDAVVYYILKFDDPYLFEFPEMKDFLDKNGIPVLRIEAEHNTSTIGQINTRLQAFMETLKLRSFKKAKINGRAYQKNPV